MGVDLTTYRVRIGRYNIKRSKSKSNDEQSLSSLSNIILSAAVIAILLIIGNVEINPGPNTYDNVSGLKTIEDTLTKLVTAINELTNENRSTNIIIKQNKVDIMDIKKDILLTKKEIKRQDYAGRLNNIILYGVEERGFERNIDTFYIVCEIFNNFLGINLQEHNFNNIFRIGRGKNRPILIKLNSYITKQQILDRTSMLKGSNYSIDNDYDFETRQKRRKLLPFLREARSKGFRANLIKDKLKINGKLYDLEHLEQGSKITDISEEINKNRNLRRSRSNSPWHYLRGTPNWQLRSRRFSSSERGRHNEEVEQLNYARPGTSTSAGLNNPTPTDTQRRNSNSTRKEDRRSPENTRSNHSIEHTEIQVSSPILEEFQPLSRRSKSPTERNGHSEGNMMTQLRSGTQIYKNFNRNNSSSNNNNNELFPVFNKNTKTKPNPNK